MKGENNRFTLRFFSTVFAFLTFISVPFSAFSMNLDYLEAEKWTGNSNVTIEEISKKKALGYELSGVFGYYADNSMCIYTYFSIDETSFFNETDELKNQIEIRFDFKTPEEVYSFSVDKDGISENSGKEEKDLFTSCQNYDNITREYLAAVQYNGKERECLINIAISINGHNYKIKDKIFMELPTTTTTTKPTKLKTTKVKTTKAKTTKEKTTKKKTVKKVRTTVKKATKRKAATSRKSRRKTKQRSAKSAKNLDFEEVEESDEAEDESETNSEESSEALQSERELSLFGRYLLLILPILAILAIFFFFIAAKRSSRKDDEKQL